MTLRARTIDLSADVGELPGPSGRSTDRRFIERVTTVHVACGGHAGDEQSMRAGVVACRDAGTRIGAHPSYDDREGFGRAPSHAHPAAVAATVGAQIDTLARIADAEGGMIESVKLHGQLYHDLDLDERVRAAVIEAIAARLPGVALVLAAGSSAVPLARTYGLVPVAEGFIDRAYGLDGRLVPRSHPGSLLEDPLAAAAQAVALVAAGVSLAGTTVPVDSLCIHSDSPGSLRILEEAAASLHRAGVVISAVER